MSVPTDRWYSQDHQWIKPDGDGWRVGLTDFAQQAIGEITVVRLAQVGDRIESGAELGEVEAFKAMTDLYMPVAATIVEFNTSLEGEPATINSDPYGQGWLCRVAVEGGTEAVESLLDADSYSQLIGTFDA